MIEAGSKIGNYKVTRLLGEGGMGRVFEAVHEQIGRRAAIKVLHAQFAHNSEAYTRFLNEARAVNIIQHPGLVNVFEFGQTEDGSPFIVMEFLEGETLADRLATIGRMSMGALRIARQIASALMAAHAKHIVHRDLKPANVMLVPDPDMPGGERVKVVDFGIAKISAEHNDTGYKTRAGAILGTPTYMSPEQCRGAGEVTDKTDVYALGVMIYEMLVGRPPFVAEGGGEIMGMHLFQAPTPLHMLEPTLPLDLVDLVHSMLSKDPDARPSIVQVAQELDRIGGRLSGPMQAVSPDMVAMASEPKPPGPLTIPIDLRRQAQVTSVSHAAATPPSGTSQPVTPSTTTPMQPFVPVHPFAAPVTPSHYTPAPVIPPYVTPTPYTPYITPSHHVPPYVTPSPYTPAPPSGLTPPLGPPPAAPPGYLPTDLPSQSTPPLAPTLAVVQPEPVATSLPSGPGSVGATQILSSGTTPITPPPSQEAPSQSAVTPVTHPAAPAPAATSPHMAPPAAPAAHLHEAAQPAAEAALGSADAAIRAEPETATLVPPDPQAGLVGPAQASLAVPVDDAAHTATPVAPLAASDSGPVKAGPHSPTIGVSESAAEPVIPTATAESPTAIGTLPVPLPTTAIATPTEPAAAALPSQMASQAEPAGSLLPLSTAVVSSAPAMPHPAHAATEDKRALKTVLVGLAVAAVILLAGLVTGLMLRARTTNPTVPATVDDAAVQPSSPSAGVDSQPPPSSATAGSAPGLTSPAASDTADLGHSGPDLAPAAPPGTPPAVTPTPTAPRVAPANAARPDEIDPKTKKKKPLLRRKKGLRNEEIEYLD